MKISFQLPAQIKRILLRGLEALSDATGNDDDDSLPWSFEASAKSLFFLMRLYLNRVYFNDSL